MAAKTSPLNDIEAQLDNVLREAAASISEGVVLGNWQPAQTKRAIMSLIIEAERRGRVDELRRLKKIDCFNVGYSMDKRPAVHVDYRLKQLNKEEQ